LVPTSILLANCPPPIIDLSSEVLLMLVTLMDRSESHDK
jgi:hypothetical protein